MVLCFPLPAVKCGHLKSTKKQVLSFKSKCLIFPILFTVFPLVATLLRGDAAVGRSAAIR
jgi:hypothetical protein